MKKLKKFQAAFLITLITVTSVQLAQDGNLMTQWEYSTWSWRQKAMARPSTATDDIKIILLDQASLDWGASVNGLSWPWPREIYALLINFIRRAEAKLIVFDVIYSEASIYGVADDQQFAQAIATNPVILGVFLGQQKLQAQHWPVQIPASPITLLNRETWLQQFSGIEQQLQASFPVDILAKAAPLLAHVNEQPDIDGVFRRLSLFNLFDQQVLPSMGFAAYLFAKTDKQLNFTEGFLLKEQGLSSDKKSQVILKFTGPSGTHQSFSAAAIIQAELHLQAGEPSPIDLSLFKDKYIFFGFSAPGLKDLRPTPVSGDYPGVEIHATLLDNLLAHNTIHTVPDSLFLSVCFILVLLCSLAVIVSASVIGFVLYALIFISIPVLIAWITYDFNIWWPLVPSEIMLIMSLVGAITFNYIVEGRQKRFIRSAFNQYLSAEVIKHMLENPERLKLGGEQRELSILFSDIQGFTSIAEKLTPEQLVLLLNDFLTDMTDIIMDEGGTLDKYEGDAIVAFWNAPLSQADHAMCVCRTVLRCQRKLDERREEFYQRTGSWIYVRFGVHTGVVVVGNIGSKQRFDYTMIGDSANLASRLEGANKFFGTYTMISETTWQQVRAEFIGREIGTLQVVGRQTPITVYELLGYKDEVLRPEIEQYNQALALYKQARLKDAAILFAPLKSDPVAMTYLRRCQQEQDNIPVDWQSVWVLTEK